MDFSHTHSTQRTCLKGHVIDNEAGELGGDPQLWCHICGAETIDKCPSCDGPLRGHKKYTPLRPDPKPDDYCVHCGRALPWTASRQEALREIAKHIDKLTEDDRRALAELLPDLVCSTTTPSTEVAVVKMKSLLKKGGAVFTDAARNVLADVISETARKALFP